MQCFFLKSRITFQIDFCSSETYLLIVVATKIHLQLIYSSSDLVDRKIEEFLSCFDEKIRTMTAEAFSTQVMGVKNTIFPIRTILVVSFFLSQVCFAHLGSRNFSTFYLHEP